MFPLVVVTEVLGMRGFDYRGPKLGLTLVLAQQFIHERDAVQGLCRVGRYGDKCERILYGIEAIIDEEAHETYITQLNNSLVDLN